MPNFTFLAQNNDQDNYVRQAELLAMSIRHSNPDSKICLITNEDTEWIKEHLFDDIVPIPWEDKADEHKWKVQNRWKIYHACPYDETFVLDTDMLVLHDLTNWWKLMQNYEVFYTINVTDYKQCKLNTTYYRKMFIQNDLPDIYVALHYFKKSDFAKKFYTCLEEVMKNWEYYYEKYAPKKMQKFLSVDVCTAITIRVLGVEDKVTNAVTSFPTFVHMKPYAQPWKTQTKKWQDRITCFVNDDKQMRVGGHLQNTVFHYTEKDFTEKFYDRFNYTVSC
jgi:hypothetical protein